MEAKNILFRLFYYTGVLYGLVALDVWFDRIIEDPLKAGKL
jgi:hypothetical protein